MGIGQVCPNNIQESGVCHSGTLIKKKIGEVVLSNFIFLLLSAFVI